MINARDIVTCIVGAQQEQHKQHWLLHCSSADLGEEGTECDKADGVRLGTLLRGYLQTDVFCVFILVVEPIKPNFKSL